MYPNFFARKLAETAQPNNIEIFFNFFPEIEFWRFFVERVRYDCRPLLYQILYAGMYDVPTRKARKIPWQELEKEFAGMTIGEVYHYAEKEKDKKLMRALNDVFHAEDIKQETITSLFNKHQAWVGFESNEPGYLLAVTKGFRFAVEHLLQSNPLTLDFIKQLHKTCTQNVHNMNEQIPGEFRTRGTLWQMSLTEADSPKGLVENIKYLKSVEAKKGNSGVAIEIKFGDSVKVIQNFQSCDANELSQEIFTRLLIHNEIHYHAIEPKKLDTGLFLEEVCTQHINELEADLKESESKIQKLFAIFNYLKHTVLHHPFQDGVGRTFSMVLLQYLLMRENLLPVLFLNSNMIPGYSAEELVEEYLRAEQEMQMIINIPDYISSKELYTPNANTSTLLASLDDKDRAIFNDALSEFQELKRQVTECFAYGSSPN